MPVPSRPHLSETAFLAGRSLLAELLAADIAARLDEAAVDALLIKGPVTERWLYGPAEVRSVGDVDIVVDPRRYRRAEAVLIDAGFVNRYDGPAPDWAEEHADRWLSADWVLPVDLHRRLWGFESSAATVWDRLWADRVEIALAGGRSAWAPAAPARVLLVALHAAHHETAAKSTEDLRRALARFDRDVWRAAAGLARDLGASEGLAAGLELLPTARETRAELGLTEVDARMRETSSELWSAAPTTAGFMRLASAPGVREKLGLLRRELWPSPAFMRNISEGQELARRGRAGLLASYVVRWGSLAKHMVKGFAQSRRLGRRGGN